MDKGIVHRIEPGFGFAPIGWKQTSRNGHPAVLLTQGTSWIAIPTEVWDTIVDDIDDTLDREPELGRLFSSRDVVTAVKRVDAR